MPGDWLYDLHICLLQSLSTTLHGTAHAKIASSTQISAFPQMPSDNTTPEPPPTPSTSSSSGADSRTPFPSSERPKSSYSSEEPQEAVPRIAKFDDQLEHGNHIEIEATDGFQSGKLNTTPTGTSSLDIPTTSGRLHNPQVLVQDGLEWEQETFDLKLAWNFEPSANAVADVATKALRCRNLISTQSLLNKPFLEFQGAFNKIYSITSNNASYLMRLSCQWFRSSRYSRKSLLLLYYKQRRPSPPPKP